MKQRNVNEDLLEETGRKYECYECSARVVQLSSNSRCMGCMERRLKFNENEAERAMDEVSALKAIVLDNELGNLIIISELEDTIEQLRGV